MLDVKMKLSSEIPVTPLGSGAGDGVSNDWSFHQRMAAELIPLCSQQQLPAVRLRSLSLIPFLLFVTPYPSAVGLETSS